MSTVDKALSVLDLFSEARPSLGPSEIARQLGWDKSNVHRYVRSLAARGLLEQDPRDRTYHLGPALSRLALVRERTHPVAAGLRRVLSDVVAETGETAHASALVGDELHISAVVETKIRGTRVYVDPSEPLPFHASGSGVAVLAASRPERVRELLDGNLARFTPSTPQTPNEVTSLIEGARVLGYAKMEGSFESDVVGVAAAVLGFDGLAIGAVAVATPSARFGPRPEAVIAASVRGAAERISKMHGAP